MNGSPAKSDQHEDLEIKDARLIFDAVWESLEEELGHEQLRFPKEIILLGGAPGAGKGTNTQFIMRARGLTCPPIVISALLDSPEAKKIKDAGGMVGDREVIGILLRTMLDPKFRDGAILDGFPRTKVQVETLRLLVEKIKDLYREYQGTALAGEFRKPTIHAMLLFVEEATSIERQLERGRKVAAQNQKVRDTGIGQIQELRITDLDPEAAKQRYRVFKEKTWDALQSLREEFFYHFINAEGSFAEVEANILDELKYQSSLELDGPTFDVLRDIALASEIIVHARQDLVRRLDTYQRSAPDLFKRVAQVINRSFMPIIQRHAISGLAAVNSQDEVFEEPEALAMLIDIFSERGYHASVDKRLKRIPTDVDLKTGKINTREEWVYRIRIKFEGSEIRRG